jgi:hypothetical protein
MRVVKQSLKLPIINLDAVTEERSSNRRHGNLFPNHLRSILCGPSGCGKTNAMLSLLYEMNGLRFENVYIYSKSLYQGKYEFLKKVLNNVNGLKYFMYNDNVDVLDPNDARMNSVFIFDDVSCEQSQQKIRSYFSMGRHKNIDCFYLCQTYTRIPKHLIRDNANMIVCFRQDDLNLKHIYNDHVNSDFSFEKFKSICSNCWNGSKFGCLVLMKENDLSEGRYRNGFDEYITI